MTRCWRIDRDIPLPPANYRRGGRPTVTPWHQLKVGDSVLLASENAALNGEAWAERNGREFVRQKQTDGSGWRIWRKA